MAQAVVFPNGRLIGGSMNRLRRRESAASQVANRRGQMPAAKGPSFAAMVISAVALFAFNVIVSNFLMATSPSTGNTTFQKPNSPH